jgi:hypothetical protein
MLGLPVGVWVMLGIVVVLAVLARVFYSRWRGMCRSVREDLTRLLPEKHPEAKVLREEMGNLVVQMQDGSERVWEMADVYAEVARLPGMGRDPQDRTRVYHNAVTALLAPSGEAGPLSLATHGEWIKPLLVPQQALEQSSSDEALHTPLPELGLAVLYVLDVPKGRRHLTRQDGAALGMDAGAVHRLALDNLGENFPREMVQGALEGNGSAVQFGDSLDATRLLLVPGCLQPGQEVLALAPHRDMLLLLPASMLDDPEKLQEGLSMVGCEGHPALLQRPVRVTHTGFQLV